MPAIPLPSNLSVFKRVSGADPAANAEVSTTVPAGKFWWLLSIELTLVQGLTQTPQPVLVIDDGTTNYFEAFGSITAQAVSTTCVYTWAQGMGPPSGLIGATTNVHATASIPNDLVLAPGHRIRTTTAGIGANSDYGVPSYYVIEIG